MKKIFIRVKPDDMGDNTWMITVQAVDGTKKYPETVGYLDDDLNGLYGTKEEMYKWAEKLRVEEQKANTDAKVIVVKR